MHFMVTFEINAPPERQDRIRGELTACLEPHARVEAVRDAHVVQVMGYGVYEDVQKKLLETARRQEPDLVRFVMTPLQNRGLYHGRMRRESAEKIHTLTD